MLAKIIKMEADIRATQEELDAVGMMVENKLGTQIPNPLISVIDALEQRQIAVIRSMSLKRIAHDPRKINGTTKAESEARAAFKDVGVAGLITQPRNKSSSTASGLFMPLFGAMPDAEVGHLSGPHHTFLKLLKQHRGVR